MWRSVGAWMSCAVSRTRSPERITAPSTTASTFSSRAISGSDFLVALYCAAEVWEITRRRPILARFVVSSSAIPSARYSCDGSPERFCSGKTAIDRISNEGDLAKMRVRSLSMLNHNNIATIAAKANPLDTNAYHRHRDTDSDWGTVEPIADSSSEEISSAADW